MSHKIFLLARKHGFDSRLMSRFKETQPKAFVTRLPAVLGWLDTQNEASKLRSTISDKNLRSFLAALLNSPTRDSAFNVIEQITPSRTAEETVIKSISEMLCSGALGIKVKGESIEMIIQSILRKNDFKSVMRYLTQDGIINITENQEDYLKRVYQCLHESPIFAALWREDTLNLR